MLFHNLGIQFGFQIQEFQFNLFIISPKHHYGFQENNSNFFCLWGFQSSKFFRFNFFYDYIPYKYFSFSRVSKLYFRQSWKNFRFVIFIIPRNSSKFVPIFLYSVNKIWNGSPEYITYQEKGQFVHWKNKIWNIRNGVAEWWMLITLLRKIILYACLILVIGWWYKV